MDFVNDPIKIAGYLLYSIYVLSSLWLFLNALVQLHLLWHYKRIKTQAQKQLPLPAELPFITIQVPVYNEKFVIERLLQSLTRLDYPKERFEIQVLDDS